MSPENKSTTSSSINKKDEVNAQDNLEKPKATKKTRKSGGARKTIVKKKIVEKKVATKKIVSETKVGDEKEKVEKKPLIKINIGQNQQKFLPAGDEEEKEAKTFNKQDYFDVAREEVKRQIGVDNQNNWNIDSVKKEEKKHSDSQPTNLIQTSARKTEAFAPKSIKTIINNQAEEESVDNLKSKHSLRLYRNIALLFVVATLFLVMVIGYFTLVRVKITLIPNQENVSNNMVFNVYDKEKNAEANASAIVGVVKKINIKLDKNYPATGEEIVGKEAVGEATIYNNYEKNQPLVATTRLLSPDGKLFRIKDTVNVPAGGTVSVAIYADQPSEEMAIEPTKFTIPGLWAGLQDKIYAQSDKAVVYQQKVNRYIVSEDIENSKRNMKQAILDEAKKQVEEEYKDYNQITYSIDEASLNSQIDAKVGDAKDEFPVKMNADVVVVAFDEEKVKKLTREKFILSLPENKEIVSFNDKNITYTSNSNDLEKGIATINTAFDGKVTLKDSSSIVDVKKIIGLNKDQVRAYLDSLPDIAGYEIKFTPSWLWKVPKFIEISKIQIEIKK